jgi:hypothetical protein
VLGTGPYRRFHFSVGCCVAHDRAAHHHQAADGLYIKQMPVRPSVRPSVGSGDDEGSNRSVLSNLLNVLFASRLFEQALFFLFCFSSSSSYIDNHLVVVVVVVRAGV